MKWIEIYFSRQGVKGGMELGMKIWKMKIVKIVTLSDGELEDLMDGHLEKSSAYKWMVFNSVRLYEEWVIQPFSIQDSGSS